LTSTPDPVNSVFSQKEIQKFRNDTSGTDQVIHLNNAGSGLMPDSVSRAQIDHIELESKIGGYEASAAQADLITDFYRQAAQLLNCKPTNIAFTSSATDSFSRALSSIPFKRGDVVLTDCDDFVSNQIQFLSLQKRMGIEIVHIRDLNTGGVDLDDLHKKLHQLKPRLLAITHVPTNSGLVQPVHDIGEIYRAYAAKNDGKTSYILDACQSAGQIPLDVQKLNCDFLSLTCRKFLRGPRGTGVLYISDDTLERGLEPMFIDMRGAEWTEQNVYKQQPDAKRFEDWEFAYSGVIGSGEAIRYYLHIGQEKVKAQVKFISGYMRTQLVNLPGVKVLDRGNEISGATTFHVYNDEPKRIVQELAREKINVVASYRAYGLIDFDAKGVSWAIRASPHYYNTTEEIDKFIEVLKQIIKGK
jgi:selenocysteine lyase/cysteine desulfurase